ncbi:hypothetical protein CJ030_MR5G021752 [Morella rubra]|uniref:Uncharacterized protein n=1 Tax=Morella rubra TaxID=262757 RepID=A0A6A1VKA0_9ROSI|nr:hypothetical protein CJ030_MR5G021752 [Morella rubra]
MERNHPSRFLFKSLGILERRKYKVNLFAARTRSGGKTAKTIPPPYAAFRTIPQLAGPQTPVTEVASQPTVIVTKQTKSTPTSASQPLSLIGSRLHRRFARLVVGRKSGSSSSHGDQKEDPIVVEHIAGDDKVTHEPTPQLGRVSWGTPQTLWAQFESGFIANQNKSGASSSRVVVPTIDQAIKRIEGKMKRSNDDKHT